MATHIGIGYSHKKNHHDAAVEAAVIARRQLPSNSADLIILLATSEYCNAEIISSIKSVISSANLIGSSASAIILSDQILIKGIAVLAIKSDTILFHCDKIPINSTTNMRIAGFELCRNIVKDAKAFHRQGCFLIGDGFYRQSHEFFQGTGEVLGSGSPFIAALSSHSQPHCKNIQFFDDQMLDNHVIGAAFYSQNRLNIESACAYKPLGKPRFVTKSFEHILRTIDEKPAVSIYEEFLKVTADTLRTDPLKPHQMYPLGFFKETSGRYLIRNPVDILADGSIVFYGDIPESSEVHLMISSKETCNQTAFDAAQSISVKLEGKTPELLLIFESTARHRQLGHFAHQEIMRIRDALGYTIPVFGFYSLGEAAPWQTHTGNKYIELINGGLILTAIS